MLKNVSSRRLAVVWLPHWLHPHPGLAVWRKPSSRWPGSTPCRLSSNGPDACTQALKAAEARGEIEYKASENVSNADYERVMREYATGGNQLIVGEAFAVEAAARKVAKDFPKVSFLMGSSGKPQAPNFSVFDNYIQEPAYLSAWLLAA
jgi:basic membrane lipoprotein Med (substrate-binding protein (PBP1-ABC) superfamily)